MGLSRIDPLWAAELFRYFFLFRMHFVRNLNYTLSYIQLSGRVFRSAIFFAIHTQYTHRTHTIYSRIVHSLAYILSVLSCTYECTIITKLFSRLHPALTLLIDIHRLIKLLTVPWTASPLHREQLVAHHYAPRAP